MIDKGDENRLCDRRRFLKTAAAGGAAAFVFRSVGSAVGGEVNIAKRPAPRRPNIILLVTDDQRWDRMGCMGDRIIKTPNMDRLAAEGVLFVNNFCTTSICMSSRASIFTGMYLRRHQINSFKQPLPRALLEKTYPLLLRAAGYRTGFVGKWGLGGPLPKDRFDYYAGFPGQGQYFEEVDGRKVHLTRIITDKIVEFIQTCSKDKPFCLSVSFKAPHVQDGYPEPFRYDPAFESLYKDVEIPVPKTAAPEYFERLPEFVRRSEGRTRWKRRFANPQLYQKSVKGYYRLITGVDVAIGALMKALEEKGFADNTVIIHTGDNGFFLGEHGLAGKWLMYEESIRTPLIIRHPWIPEKMRGRRSEEMTLNIDLAPTILDLAGVPVPKEMQGRSMKPLLFGQRVKWRDDWFYEHHFVYGGRIPQSEGVRTKRWKYIRYIGQKPPYEELYDLENDPYEENNLVPTGKYASVLDSLRKRWREFGKALV